MVRKKENISRKTKNEERGRERVIERENQKIFVSGKNGQREKGAKTQKRNGKGGTPQR